MNYYYNKKGSKIRTNHMQLVELVNLVDRDSNLHSRAYTGPMGMRKYRRSWEQVGAVLNTMGPRPKCWETVWRSLVKRVKKRKAEALHPNSRSVKPLTDLELQVLNILARTKSKGDPAANEGPPESFPIQVAAWANTSLNNNKGLREESPPPRVHDGSDGVSYNPEEDMLFEPQMLVGGGNSDTRLDGVALALNRIANAITELGENENVNSFVSTKLDLLRLQQDALRREMAARDQEMEERKLKMAARSLEIEERKINVEAAKLRLKKLEMDLLQS